MSDRENIGVFGGTFDPIHNAHLDIARTALRKAGLDRIVFVVAARPPHKRDEATADPEDRMAMVELALARQPGMEPSRMELDRAGPSYTADTLKELHQQYPHASLHLILGSDSLLDLPQWHRPDEILSQARLLIACRPEAVLPSAPELDGKFDLLPFEETDLSSTVVRRRIRADNAILDLVPADVARYIREKGLYHDDA